MPVYQRFKTLYFTHLYWLTAILPQEFQSFITYQISDHLFLFSLLQSFVSVTLMGVIIARLYDSDSHKSRMD